MLVEEHLEDAHVGAAVDVAHVALGLEVLDADAPQQVAVGHAGES